MRRIVLSLIAGLVAVAAWAQVGTFTNGVFFINEDRYGPNQGSINYYNYNSNQMEYNVYALVNPETKLGVTTQHGQLYGGRLFLVSKQANGSESHGSTYGSRLAVLDAETLIQQGSVLRFGQSMDSVYDGRSYCAVNPQKGYVATNAGIFVFYVNSMTVGDLIEGTRSSAGKNNNGLYHGQCGDMVRFGQYVFAVQQEVGLHVIDPVSDTVVKTLPFPNIVTVFVTANGNLYVANNSREVYDFSGGPYVADFTRIDPVSLTVMQVYELDDDTHGALSSWGAWRARMLCVDPERELIYYNYDEYQNYISCYDFTTGEFIDHFIDLPEAVEINWDGTRNHQGLYASALSFDPHTGGLVVQTTEAAPMYAYQIFDHNWVLFYDVATGELKRQVRLNDAYWFPAMAVYPDLYGPTVSVADVTMSTGGEMVIDLLQAVEDADNMAALAVTMVTDVDDHVVRAWVSGLELHLVAMAAGQSTVTLMTDSNGKFAEASFNVTVNDAIRVGDVDGNGSVDVADVTMLIAYILADGSMSIMNDQVADIDHNGTIDVADVTALIRLILNDNL